MGALNANIDRALANANVRGIRLFSCLREDHELNIVDPGEINRIIPGYGDDIANDINAQLLNTDQSILEAVGILLPGAGNVIIAITYIKILMHLEKLMSMGGLHTVNHKQEYARILLHLKEALEVFRIENQNPHCTDNFINPLHHDNGIHELKRDMLRGLHLSRSDAVVYVCKDTLPYKALLQSLADHLMQ